MAGNAGSGSGKHQFPGVIEGAGAQALSPSIGPEAFQNPGAPTPVGSFNITQLSNLGPAYTAGDKIGKDTNFRGLTIYNNVVYYTKGSGGNGVNTVYFIDTTGKACPSTVPRRRRPAAARRAAAERSDRLQPGEHPDAGRLSLQHVHPRRLPDRARGRHERGVLPVRDLVRECEHDLPRRRGQRRQHLRLDDQHLYRLLPPTRRPACRSGSSTPQTWQLAYTLQNGLNLGVPYTVAGYPTGDNTGPFGTGLPWAPATDGLRNITGRVNRNGTATIWAETSTVSGSGDEGADPNKVVAITDQLSAATAPAGEAFTTIESAKNGEVLRGVSFTPGTTNIDGAR